jgi:hypothetical protein
VYRVGSIVVVQSSEIDVMTNLYIGLSIPM